MQNPESCRAKAEFHIGDRLVVMYAGRYVPFVVKNITRADDGTTLYSGDEQPWTPQCRLDYDIDEEKQRYLRNAEERIHALALAFKDVEKMDREDQFCALPPSIQLQLKARLGDAILP